MKNDKYSLIQTNHFKNDIIEFSVYCQDYDPKFWVTIVQKIKLYINDKILRNPFRYPFFYILTIPFGLSFFLLARKQNIGLFIQLMLKKKKLYCFVFGTVRATLTNLRSHNYA